MKKILIGIVFIIGLIYGTGYDLTSVKEEMVGKSELNAQRVTGGSGGGWGSDSGGWGN